MQVTIKATNRVSFFIGEITLEEADSVRTDNPEDDGFGYYLVEIENDQPKKSGNVLAKFMDESAARAVANIFRARGLTEA